MNENSTHALMQISGNPGGNNVKGTYPERSAVDFVRQFARVYVAVSQMPGIVLN